jgi:hypothetical protein
MKFGCGVVEQRVLVWLKGIEDKLVAVGPVGTDSDTVKWQINLLQVCDELTEIALTVHIWSCCSNRASFYLLSLVYLPSFLSFLPPLSPPFPSP